jgi:hypothetical protein
MRSQVGRQFVIGTLYRVGKSAMPLEIFSSEDSNVRLEFYSGFSLS